MAQFTHIWDKNAKKKQIFTFTNDLPDEVAIGITLLIDPALQVLKTERRDEDETELQKYHL